MKNLLGKWNIYLIFLYITVILLFKENAFAGGTVFVSTSPSGASIYFDGGYVGSSPVSLGGIPPGTHSVSASMSGYETGYTSVTVEEGLDAYASITLYPLPEPTAVPTKRPSKGTLYIGSDPPGASISIDGAGYGIAPTSVSLSPGSHTVSFYLEGYESSYRRVYIEGGGSTSVSATLIKSLKPGKLVITSTPAEADVYIDNNKKGKTSFSKDMNPGKYTVKLIKQNYKPFVQEVKIEEEKTFTLIAKLIGKPGVIIIKNKPEGATVFIDGKDKADVVELPGVPTGAHLIEIKKEGHENYSKEFSLKPGQKLVIDVTMEKLPEITPALEPTFTPVSEEVTPTALVEPNSSLPFIDNKYLLILLFVVLFLFLGGVIAFLTLFHKRKKKAIPDEKNKPRIFKGKRTGEVIKSDEVEIVREFSVESLLDASEVQEDDEDDEESPPYRPIGPYRESVKSIYPSSVEDMSPFEEKIQSISGFKPYKDKEDTIEEEPKNIPRRPHYNTYDMEQEEPVADKEESCYRKDGFDLKGEIGNNYGGLSIPQVRRPSSEEEVYEERQRLEIKRPFTGGREKEYYEEPSRLEVRRPSSEEEVYKERQRLEIKRPFTGGREEEYYEEPSRLEVRRPSSEEEVYEERQRVEKRTVEIQVEPYLERPRLNVKKPITQSTVQESMIRPQITPVDINPELVTEKRKEFSKGFLKPKRETREVSEGIFPRSISRETADVGLKSQETYDVGDKIEKKFMPVSAEQITTPTNELEPRMTSVVKEELPYKTYMRQNNLNQTDETSEIEEILKRVYLSTKRQVPARAHMILGDYEIIEKIGSGSMAKVYKAKRNFTNEIVAVKIPYEHLLNDEDFINRFFQEANKCKEINHPNIAKVYDAASNEDCIYMIMEFVDAMTLREILRLSGITNMDVLWSINFIIKICEGLNYLHSKRIIHSDIKPENIMVSPTGELKIMDYVTFKSVAQIGPTKGGFFAGTPHYMPPEVLSKDGVDERSDIYSLGIVFYELITGGVPFSGSNPLVIMKKHKEEEPLLLRKIVPSIPEEIEKIVLKMIAKAPRDRFSSVRVVSALLSGYLTMRATDKNYLKPKPFNYASDSYDNLNP